MWEPTAYALQMSSCLIINPVFHAYVNFIITDTCIHSEGCTRARMCLCTHTFSHTLDSPPSKLPQVRSSCIKGSCLSCYFISSSFLRFLGSVTSHIFSFPFASPCSPSLFPTQSFFSPLPLSALPTCQGDSLPKRSDVFFFFVLFYIHLPFLES